MRYLFIIEIVVLSVLFSCDKDAENGIPEFIGITSTDQNAVVIGGVDTTDWRENETWLQIEKDLFSDFSSLSFNYSNDSSMMVSPAFPNPCSDILNLNYQKDSSVELQLRFVDEDFNLLFSLNSIYSDAISVSLNDITSLNSGDKFRVYYIFKQGITCIAKGHGDCMKF
jgi:hypothetical protein